MRTIIWFVYFWLYLLAAIPVSGYIWILEKRGQDVRADVLVQRMVNRWAHRLMRLAGAKVEVTGREHLPDGPAVYIANHQGNFDIPIMLTVLREPHGLVAKGAGAAAVCTHLDAPSALSVCRPRFPARRGTGHSGRGKAAQEWPQHYNFSRRDALARRRDAPVSVGRIPHCGTRRRAAGAGHD